MEQLHDGQCPIKPAGNGFFIQIWSETQFGVWGIHFFGYFCSNFPRVYKEDAIRKIRMKLELQMIYDSRMEAELIMNICIS